MAARPRFPGRPRKSIDSKPQWSYKRASNAVSIHQPSTSSATVNARKKTEEMDYGKIAAQTATNLKAFRMLFGTSDEDDEAFHGFHANGKLAKSVKDKQKAIKKEIRNLENQLRHAYGRRSSAAVRQTMLPNGSEDPKLSTQVILARNAKEKGFRGFSDDDSIVEILNKKRRLISEQIMILSSEIESLSDSDPTLRDKESNVPSSSNSQQQLPAPANSNHGSLNAQVLTNGFNKPSVNAIRQRAEDRMQSQHRNNHSQMTKDDSDIDHSHPEGPNGSSVISAVDGVNFYRPKGARVKQVNFCSGVTYGYPRATFADIKNQNGQYQGFAYPNGYFKDASQMPSALPPEALRSGKRIAPDAEDFEEEMDSEDIEGDLTFTSANGEILLDRQGGHTRRMGRKRKLIKPLSPLDISYVDSFGFPVIIDRSVGSLPPKPLCFLCGSAGIEQLIFCSSCCEPYHPYCTNDKSVLSLFVARTTPKSLSHQGSNPKSRNSSGLSTLSDGNPSHVRNLSSILSPPLTPDHSATDDLEGELAKNRNLEVLRQLREWTCRQCTTCQHCGLAEAQHQKKADEEEYDFLKCWNCRLSFHSACISKRSSGKDPKGRWACGDCFKCKSCNKKVDFKTFEACHADDEGENPGAKFLFCRECIRKRQRGSFCPVCNVCYDDNDYDTRMMECGSCKRWIHGKCENLSEEHYQILSGLPESIEFVCRLCETTGHSIWKRAIKLELSIGCEAVLRIFQKKALTTSRKSSPVKSNPIDCIDVTELLPTPPESSRGSVVGEEELPKEAQDGRTKALTVRIRDFLRNPKTDEEKHCQQKFSYLIEIPEESQLHPESLFVETNDPVDQRVGELTPMKDSANCSNAVIESVTLIGSPTKFINAYVDSNLDIERQFLSVKELNQSTTEFLKSRFGSDPSKLEILQTHFDSALKEVFPWYHSDEVKKSDLEMTVEVLPNDKDEDATQVVVKEVRKWKPEWDHLEPQNPFLDTFWLATSSTDTRTCVLCKGVGDSPPDFCGRLLYAGLDEWLHVNCVLWSSEVWEGQDGALQQVGSALGRSKTLRCGICKKYGASISCCHQSCRNAYHFPCALNSSCRLMEDSSLFCPQHSKKARGEVQQDLEVMRRVFIDSEWIMKKEKEKLAWSSNLSIFIGSLRIDQLGYVFPISVSRDSSGRLLTPVQYQCSRLFWCTDSMFAKKVLSVSTFIGSKRPEMFCLQAEQVNNFVVDHSQDTRAVEKQMCQLQAFQEWTDFCPIYVDEYKTTWFPPCPFLQESVEDGNEADEEDNVQKEDFEVQTSFSNCSTRGSSLSPGRSALDNSDSDSYIAEIFSEPLTEDLNSFADDLGDLFTSNSWPSTGDKKHVDRMCEDYLNEFMQVDGACDFTSSDSSSLSSRPSESEDAEADPCTRKSDTPSKRSPQAEETEVRRGRSAASASPASTQGRLLRSRKKQPLLQVKPEEHKCPKCKKTFQTPGSVGRHIRWCEPKKGKVKTADKKKVSTTGEVREETSETPRQTINVTKALDAFAPPSTSKSARESMIARTARKQAWMSAENDSVSESEESEGSKSDEKDAVVANTNTVTAMPKKSKLCSKSASSSLACHKCNNIYRTEESLRKHLETCTALSSSDGDDNESEEEVEDSISPTRQVAPTKLANVAEAEVKESSESEEETLSESEEEPTTAEAQAPEGVVNVLLPHETPYTEQAVEVDFGQTSHTPKEKTNQIITPDADAGANEVYAVVNTSAPRIQTLPLPEASQLYNDQPPIQAEYGNQIGRVTDQSRVDSAAVAIQNLNQNVTNEHEPPTNAGVFYYNQSNSGPLTLTTPESSGNSFVPPGQSGLNAPVQIAHYDRPITSLPGQFGQSSGNVIPFPQSSHQAQGMDPQAAYYAQVQQQQRLMYEQQIVNPAHQPQQQRIEEWTGLNQAQLQNSAGFHSLQQQQQQHVQQQGNFGVPLPAESSNYPQAQTQQYQNIFVQDAQGNIRQIRVPVQNSVPQSQVQQPQQIIMPQSGLGYAQANDPLQRSLEQQAPSMQQQGHHMVQSAHGTHYFVREPQSNHPQSHNSDMQQMVPQQCSSHVHYNTTPIAPRPPFQPQHQQPANENVTYVVLRPDASIPMQMSEHSRSLPPGHHENVPSWAQPAPRPQLLMNSGQGPSTIVQVLQPHAFGCSSGSSHPGGVNCPMRGHSPSRGIAIHSQECSSVNQGDQCSCPSCKGHSTNASSDNFQVHFMPNRMLHVQERFPPGSASEIMQQQKIRKPRAQIPVPNAASAKKSQRGVVYRTRMTPPKILPATTASLPLSTSAVACSLSIAPSTSSVSGTSGSLSAKPTSLNPNVAVVRPMEHPLMSIQKMSEKIVQAAPPVIRFISPPTMPSSQTTASPSQAQAQTATSSEATETNQGNKTSEAAEVVQNQTIPELVTLAQTIVKHEDTVQFQGESKSTLLTGEAKSTNQEPVSSNTAKTNTTETATTTTNKAIKITLKRKEGGDSYSINSFSAPGSQITGTMRSLKIKAKITSGEQAGTSTDVEVQPVVHTVPIPNEAEENPTVCEDLKIQNVAPPPPSTAGSEADKGSSLVKVEPKPERLTHKAVVVYKVRCNNEVLFQSSDVHAVWSLVFEMVQGKRVTQTLPPLSYPATNISLPDNQYQGKPSFNQLGLQHRAVQFLLEQLPGIKKAAQGSQEFKFHGGRSKKSEASEVSDDDFNLPENPSGCARVEGFQGRKPFDMFGWLASKDRRPLTDTAPVKSTDVTKVADLPLAMKFRNMKKAGVKHLQVFWSVIHGRGLFTAKDIECGEMIIEYAGELIRSSLCDSREKYYESRGIGCYMFRIDEDQYVVDATMKGNAARFINHSCDPNCRSKITEIFGRRRILIFALRKIQYGEELTYDYKFPYEDVKIPCSCGTAKCKKFLN